MKYLLLMEGRREPKHSSGEIRTCATLKEFRNLEEAQRARDEMLKMGDVGEFIRVTLCVVLEVRVKG